MAYLVIVRRPGGKIRWRPIVDDLRGYPRALADTEGGWVELHTGAAIDLSHSKSLSSDEVDALHLKFVFNDDNEAAADSILDVARLLGKKYGVQFWHDAFGLDYATATEREIREAFEGEIAEDGGG